MKFSLTIFALIATVAADVSYLSRGYLPPVQHAPAISSGSSAGSSGSSIYTRQHQSIEYAQQAEEVPVLGGDAFTYGGEETQVAEPAETTDDGAASHDSYGSGQSQAAEAAAPADDGASSYGSYDNYEAQLQYQVADQQQQQVASAASDADIGAWYGEEAGAAPAGGADFSYGSYDLGSQDVGVQDFDQNHLLSHSHGNSVHVSSVAAQGPAIRAPLPASTSSGIDTQYGANGGYIY